MKAGHRDRAWVRVRNLPKHGPIWRGKHADEDTDEHGNDQELLEKLQILHRLAGAIRLIRVRRSKVTLGERNLQPLTLIVRQRRIILEQLVQWLATVCLRTDGVRRVSDRIVLVRYLARWRCTCDRSKDSKSICHFPIQRRACVTYREHPSCACKAPDCASFRRLSNEPS